MTLKHWSRRKAEQIFSNNKKDKRSIHDKDENSYDLLKYLVRNAYIDESYSDYMTYFYDDSIHITDKIFLRSISDKKAKEYNYKLKNPKIVLQQLTSSSFKEKEVLNFDLINYIRGKKFENDYFEVVIAQLKNTNNYDFLAEYYNIADDKISLVKQLNLLWPTLFGELLSWGNMDESKLKEYTVLTLCNSDENILKSVNADSKLATYISNKENYLQIDKPDTVALIDAFQVLHVSFSKMSYYHANSELFIAAYERDKLGFLQATVEFALQRDNLHDDFLNYLEGIVKSEREGK